LGVYLAVQGIHHIIHASCWTSRKFGENFKSKITFFLQLKQCWKRGEAEKVPSGTIEFFANLSILLNKKPLGTPVNSLKTFRIKILPSK
jgi:hypothetical protein